MLMSSDQSIRRQHEAIRNTAGWYYFTHHLIEVTGEDACKVLDRMCTSSISKLAVGRERYTMILDQKGIIQDDIIIFHLDENTYWVSTLHINRELSRLEEAAKDHKIAFRRITEEWDMYAVQGPNSTAFVNAIVETSVDDMKFFSIRDTTVDGIPAKVARSGFTGEKFGYEIYIPVANTKVVEEKLRANQDRFEAVEVDEVDVMAFTLSTEKGFVLMTDVYGCNPFEVEMDKNIDFSKDFVGCEALKALKEKPVTRKLVSFILEDDEALVYGGPKGAMVVKDGVVAGRATKMTYGVTIGKNIGFALIDSTKAEIGDEVTLNGYKAVLAERPLLK